MINWFKLFRLKRKILNFSRENKNWDQIEIFDHAIYVNDPTNTNEPFDTDKEFPTFEGFNEEHVFELTKYLKKKGLFVCSFCPLKDKNDVF